MPITLNFELYDLINEKIEKKQFSIDMYNEAQSVNIKQNEN